MAEALLDPGAALLELLEAPLVLLFQLDELWPLFDQAPFMLELLHPDATRMPYIDWPLALRFMSPVWPVVLWPLALWPLVLWPAVLWPAVL